MSYDSRLFNVKALREIVEISDDVQNDLNQFNDALASYEQADELPSDERFDAREDARSEAWALLGDVIAGLEHLRAFRDRLADDSAVIG